MNDVQSLMTAAAMLVMGGFGLFMYKSDEHEEDMIRDTHVEKQEIQEKTDEVAFENPLFKKVEENGGLRGQGPRGEQNFVPFFQKGETEIKPKKTRKMRKRGPSGGSRRSMSNF
jgi:hypothetical protein